MDILAVVTDLISQSRILAAAKGSSTRVRFVGAGDNIAGIPPALALVDLDAEGDVPGAIRSFKAAGLTVVAFGPHLDTEKLKAARKAGADRVLARSKFMTELPRMLHDKKTTTSGGDRLSDLLSELRQYGQGLERLGGLLQDPDAVSRLYFAPAPHMQTSEGEPIVLDEAEYLDFLAVEALRAKLEEVRRLRKEGVTQG